MKHEDLIGIPFAYGGRGPDQFDCYGLVRHIHESNGIVLPDYKSPSDGATITAMMLGELRLWAECDLKPGVVLLFKVPGNLHVGTYIGDGWFLHTWEPSGGVVRERLSDWNQHLMGVYEYVGEQQ